MLPSSAQHLGGCQWRSDSPDPKFAAGSQTDGRWRRREEMIGKDDSQVHSRRMKKGKIYHFYLGFLLILVSCRACVCIDLLSL
jgi:hypothetical protein